jgi:hypothetical protein
MALLRPVINVREIPPAASRLRAALPSLRDLISAAPTAHEQSVLAYLSQGVACCFFPDNGMAYDVFQPKRIPLDVPIGGATEIYHLHWSEILSDGVWVWPSVLLYYVHEYHLALQSHFINHAASRQWQIDPTTIDVRELDPGLFFGVPNASGELQPLLWKS